MEESGTLAAATISSVSSLMHEVMNIPSGMATPVLRALVRRYHGDTMSDELRVPRAPAANALLGPAIHVMRTRRARLRQDVAAGVGMIDTAHSYTRGESEETIGAALSANPDRVLVATKGGIGGPGHGRPEVLHAEIEESLRRLHTDSLPLYYLHRVDPETPLEESLAAIKQYRDRGKIRHVGISEVSIDEIERARQVVAIA